MSGNPPRTYPAGSPATAVVSHGRPMESFARWISGLFISAIFLDYGGGFGVKLLIGLLAMLWVATRPASPVIWRRSASDLIILIGIPLLLGMLHLMLDPSRDSLAGSLAALYATLSSPMLIALLPLATLSGAPRMAEQLRIAFRVTAIGILLALTLHTAGLINLYDVTGPAREYGVGFIGLDPRQRDVDASLRPNLIPFVSQALPLAIGLELPRSLPWALVMVAAILATKVRGLFLGAALVVALWIFFRARLRTRLKLSRLVLGAVALAAALAFSTTHLTHSILAITERFGEALGGTDWSMQIRLGYFRSYWDLLAAEPLASLIGAGPMAPIYNDALGRTVSLTEISVLNIALWYGLPYAFLYTLWLYSAAFKLWRMRQLPGYMPADTGLFIGATSFWFTGNINPQMNAPLAIIAFMLIRTRAMEIANADRQRLGSAAPSPAASEGPGTVLPTAARPLPQA